MTACTRGPGKHSPTAALHLTTLLLLPEMPSAIPNDVLCEIIENVAIASEAEAERTFGEATPAIDHALPLLQVTRAFRNAALRVPALWALVSDRMHRDRRAFSLERCRNAPLTVIIGCLRESTRTEAEDEFLRAVGQHYSRWRTLLARVHGMVFSCSMHLPPAPTFPGLSLLWVAWAPLRPVPGEDGYPIGDAFADAASHKAHLFFKAWQTPVLRELRLDDGLGVARALETVPTVALALSLCKRCSDDFWTPLGSCAALSTLELTVENCKWDNWFSPARIESVTVFALLVRNTSPYALDGVLAALHLPRLARMSVAIDSTRIDCAENDYLRAVFLPHARTDAPLSMESVHFTIDWGNEPGAHSWDSGDSALEFFFAANRFPALQQLTLAATTPTRHRRRQWRPMAIPDSLRYLDLSDVPRIPEWAVEHICTTFAHLDVAIRFPQAARGRGLPRYQQAKALPTARFRVAWGDEPIPV